MLVARCLDDASLLTHCCLGTQAAQQRTSLAPPIRGTTALQASLTLQASSVLGGSTAWATTLSRSPARLLLANSVPKARRLRRAIRAALLGGTAWVTTSCLRLARRLQVFVLEKKKISIRSSLATLCTSQRKRNVLASQGYATGMNLTIQNSNLM